MFGKRKIPAKPSATAPLKPIEREVVRPPETAAFEAQALGARRDAPEAPPAGSGSEGRKLVVGREICLTGEIKACEKLVVEGRVEADLTDSQFLEITEPGYFKGNAVVQNCEISGIFDGELMVHGSLLLERTGRINGSVYYGELTVERGGRINGTMEKVELDTKTAADAGQPGAAVSSTGSGKFPRRATPLQSDAEPPAETPDHGGRARGLAESGTG